MNIFYLNQIFLGFRGTIPCGKLKSRLYDIIDKCSFNKNGSAQLTHLVIYHIQKYFLSNHSDCVNKYSEDNEKKMFVFLIESIQLSCKCSVWKFGFPTICWYLYGYLYHSRSILSKSFLRQSDHISCSQNKRLICFLHRIIVHLW